MIIYIGDPSHYIYIDHNGLGRYEYQYINPIVFRYYIFDKCLCILIKLILINL